MYPVFFRCFLVGALSLVATLAAAQTQALSAVPGAHPLVGVWRSTAAAAPALAKAAACVETLDYRPNHIRLGTSGTEITRATYDVSAQPSADGFYRLAQTILESNGQPDCAGDRHSKADETLVRFIQFSPQKDQFIVCRSAALTACFGPFRRQTR